MDFYSLECFITVAEMRNFTHAAERLFTTQPALSRKIAALEEEYQVCLFNRNTRPLHLTEAGELFYNRAKQILSLCNRLESDMMQQRESYNMYLRIEYGMGGQMPLLSQALEQFRLIYPQAETTVALNYNRIAIQHLHENICDICLVSLPEIYEESGLYYQTVERGGLYAFFHKNHPLAAMDTVTVEQLLEEELCIFERYASPIMYDRILDIFRRQKKEIYFSKEAPDTITFTMLIAIYHCVGIMPKRTLVIEETGIVGVPIAETKGFDVVVAWNNMAVNPAIKVLADILTKQTI